jgi:ABC-type glycerol-3-phosphate transport system substrate-binding protein
MVEKVSKRNADGSLKTAAFLPRDGFGGGSWPYLFGGSYMKGDKIDVNGPDDLKAWTWVHSFAQRFGVRETQSFRSGFGNYSSPQNPFLSGKLATYMDGPWFSNFIRLYNPKIDWFAVPFPAPDGRPDLAGYTVLNLNTLMIPRGAKHPKEAFEFIRFVQRQPVMEGLCRDQRCNSPLAKVSEEFFRTHPNKAIRLFDQLARSPNAVGPVKVGIWGQIGREVGNAVDVMDLGEKSPQAALDGAQARLEEDWANYQRQVLGR